MGLCLLGRFSFIRRRYNIQRYSSLTRSAVVRLKLSPQSNSSLLSLVLFESPLDRILGQYTLYQREVTYFVDEATLKFRWIRRTRINIQLNISSLRDKVRAGEYFKLVRNYLCREVRIRRVGEYFELVRNYIRYKVRVRRIGEYFKLVRNRREPEVYYEDATFYSGGRLDNKESVLFTKPR